MSPLVMQHAGALLLAVGCILVALALREMREDLARVRGRLAETRLMLFTLVELAERALTSDPRGVPHLATVLELRRLFPEVFDGEQRDADEGDAA